MTPAPTARALPPAAASSVGSSTAWTTCCFPAAGRTGTILTVIAGPGRGRPSIATALALYLGTSESEMSLIPMRLRFLALPLLAALVAASVGVSAQDCFAQDRFTQDRRVPASPGEVRLSYAPVVQRAAPAVVNVYAARAVATTRNPFLDDPIFRRFFGVPDGGAPSEQLQRSLGSGVIVDTGGLIVTNNHVIEGATEVKVSLADKREFEADIVLKDQRSDLAVLRIRGQSERFPAIDFADSDALQVGDLVLAIGNPFAVGQTVTHGIVSAVARTQVGITDYQFFIQTDAAIN